MVSNIQPVIPPTIHLETIYEESSSSLSSSIADVHHQSRHRQKLSIYSSNPTIHGLISARSIPSVDVHRRRRASEYQQKLPIEVRHRDGTKHYIPPLLPTTMIMNRRKTPYASRHDSSSLSTKINSKYRQISNTTPTKKKKLSKKSPIVLTVITADDLSEAGITSPSTSSPEQSEIVPLQKPQSNSLFDTKEISFHNPVEVPIEKLPIATVPPSIQPLVDISVSSLYFPPAPRHRSYQQPQLRHPQQMPAIRSQSLPPFQSHFSPSTQQKSFQHQIPPVAIVPPSPKKTLPSLQITLTNDENDKNLSSKMKLSNSKTSTSKSLERTVNNESKQPFQPSTTVLVGGGSRSAFRPFLKSTTFNPQPRMPMTNYDKAQISTNNSSQPLFPPSHPRSQQFRPTSLSSTIRATFQPSHTTNPTMHDRRSVSLDAARQPVHSFIPNQVLSDKAINTNTKPKTSNYPQQSAPMKSTHLMDPSFNKANQQIELMKDSKSHSITVDPDLQWHSVTSKSLYDVPRLAYKYSDIPLRITIPDGTPTHNQKLLQKHDFDLEKRLSDAGLSPETIALYERILEVADVRQIDIYSPPDIIDQYQPKLLF